MNSHLIESKRASPKLCQTHEVSKFTKVLNNKVRGHTHMIVHGLSLCWRVFLLVNRDRTMVIAMIAMGMVQGPFIEIILMIAMGNERMPTILMPARTGDRSALSGILGIDLKHMLIVMPLV
jgi:hypothetical protein